MKRKNVMKIGLIMSIAAMMVFSASISVTGFELKNDLEKNDLVTMDTVSVNGGSILVDTADHKTCDDPIVEVHCKTVTTNKMYYYGAKVKVEVSYSIRCPGMSDHAWVDISFDGVSGSSASFDYGDGDSTHKKTGYLVIETHGEVYPGDSFKVRLHAKYVDYWGTDPRPDELLGEESCKTTVKVPELEPDLEVNSVETGKAEAGSMAKAKFNVVNIGDTDSELDWEIIEKTGELDWGSCSISPMRGYDLKPGAGGGWGVKVEVQYTLPRLPKSEVYSGQLKVVNSEDSNDYKWVTITFKAGRQGGAYQKSLDINELLLSRFTMFKIFQSLLELQT